MTPQSVSAGYQVCFETRSSSLHLDKECNLRWLATIVNTSVFCAFDMYSFPIRVGKIVSDGLTMKLVVSNFMDWTRSELTTPVSEFWLILLRHGGRAIADHTMTYFWTTFWLIYFYYFLFPITQNHNIMDHMLNELIPKGSDESFREVKKMKILLLPLLTK